MVRFINNFFFDFAREIWKSTRRNVSVNSIKETEEKGILDLIFNDFFFFQREKD